MNARVESSPSPSAHPQRSNPFRRSSSDAPPFPCITPSTVTCVLVISFMIAVPSPRGTPGGRPLAPTTNDAAPIRHLLRDFFEGPPHRIACSLGSAPVHAEPPTACPSRALRGGKGGSTSRTELRGFVVERGLSHRLLGIRGQATGDDHDQESGLQAARPGADGQDRRVVHHGPQSTHGFAAR